MCLAAVQPGFQDFGTKKQNRLDSRELPVAGGKNTCKTRKMHGSPKYQVSQVFNHSGIDMRGTSKHAAKETARETGAKTWADMGKSLGIHSHKTADAYRECWRRCFIHAREHSGLKDLTRIESHHIESYLNDAIERGVSRATYNQYAAALGKLEVALQGWANSTGAKRTFELQSGVDATRDEAKSLAKFEGSRAYERPQEIPANISQREHQLAAKMQLEGGSRINEIGLIRVDQLRDGFQIETRGKGGKILTPQFSEATYKELVGHLRIHGEFRIDHDQYRADLKLAAAETGQQYNGSHGLRWNYAQQRMEELRIQGGSHYESLALVSKEMGHERPDITQHYLR